ncbi:hypothetical protein CYMTET_25616, partial [Cymbomonas tetramitiformis]
PCGRLQCDILQSLDMPAVLIGDGRLGGISATITAYESLRARGYDVPIIAICDGSLDNANAVQVALDHAKAPTSVVRFPELPAADDPGMFDDSVRRVTTWCSIPEAQAAFRKVLNLLKEHAKA